MQTVLALNMYHYKVRVLNAKFDIDQSNQNMLSTRAAARAGLAGERLI